MRTRINGILINIGALTESELATALDHAKSRVLAAHKDVELLQNESDYRIRFGTHPSRCEYADAVAVPD